MNDHQHKVISTVKQALLLLKEPLDEVHAQILNSPTEPDIEEIDLMKSICSTVDQLIEELEELDI